MAEARRTVDGFAAGAMLLLCIIWGLQQVAIKLAAPDISPIMQLALRSAISALLVTLLMASRSMQIFVADGTLRPGLLAGALFALEFVFIAEGLRLTSASHMVVFLYTAPVFTALGLQALVPAERLRPLQWLGIAVAFGGIAIAFLGGATGAEVSSDMLIGDKGVGGYSGALVSAADADLALSTARWICPDAGVCGSERAGDADFDDACCVDESAVQRRDCFFRQLPRLVLPAAALPGVAAGGLFIHDAALRREFWRNPAQ
jgi:uncharacterized membrane protein